MGNDVAEAYMAVRAAEWGLRKAQEKLDKRLEAWRKANGIRGGLDTSLGPIDVRHMDAKIVFRDEAALLAWAKINAPHEVEEAHEEVIYVPERVRQSLPRWLADRCRIVDGEVIDTATGEVLEFASVQPASDVLAARLSPEAKTRAEKVIEAQLDALLMLVSPAPPMIEPPK